MISNDRLCMRGAQAAPWTCRGAYILTNVSTRARRFETRFGVKHQQVQMDDRIMIQTPGPQSGAHFLASKKGSRTPRASLVPKGLPRSRRHFLSAKGAPDPPEAL
jgi:hypothetical protein